MAIDPVCKMEVDEKKLQPHQNTREGGIISAPLAAKRLSTRILRSTLPGRAKEA